MDHAWASRKRERSDRSIMEVAFILDNTERRGQLPGADWGIELVGDEKRARLHATTNHTAARNSKITRPKGCVCSSTCCPSSSSNCRTQLFQSSRMGDEMDIGPRSLTDSLLAPLAPSLQSRGCSKLRNRKRTE